MNEERNDILREAEEVAEIGETKSQLKEAAIELNKVAPEREIITREQIKTAQRNAERVAKLRKSSKGKYTVIGLDKFDNEDWVEGEYNAAEEALAIAESKTNEAKHYCTDASVATVYYAYDPDGRYIGGNTWQPGERGGMLLTEKEEVFTQAVKGISPLDLQCKNVSNPWPGPSERNDVYWFQHLTLSDVYAALVPRLGPKGEGKADRYWYHKRPDGFLKILTLDEATNQEVNYLKKQKR